MAGLTANIVTSRNKAYPLFPNPDPSLGVYSGMGNNASAYYYLPGFPGGTAGRSIRLKYGSSNLTTNVYQYDADLTAITDGVWDGGMTVDEASGSANTTRWQQFFMDETDNLLYVLTANESTSPYTLYLSSVNEAGSVTAIGNAQLGNASMNNPTPLVYNGGSMYRAGGDGSGNLQIPIFNTAGGNAAAATPYRGCLLTINISDGSLSYANLLPSGYASTQVNYEYGSIGPTANNMLLSTYSFWSSTAANDGGYGALYNLSTGKANALVHLSGEFPWGNSTPYVIRWAKRYYFTSYALPRFKAIGGFSEEECHAWVDNLAVYYGLL